MERDWSKRGVGLATEGSGLDIEMVAKDEEARRERGRLIRAARVDSMVEDWDWGDWTVSSLLDLEGSSVGEFFKGWASFEEVIVREAANGAKACDEYVDAPNKVKIRMIFMMIGGVLPFFIDMLSQF